MLTLDAAEELDDALDSADADADFGCDDHGDAYVVVERDGRILYHRARVPRDQLDDEARFLAVIIGGGLI